MSIRRFPGSKFIRARGGRPQVAIVLCGFVLALSLGLPKALGDTAISLPTEGRFRPGRYMPVRVQRDAGRGAITLRGQRMLPVTLPADGPPDLVVPWLALSDIVSDLQWQGTVGPSHPIATPPHALSDDERLVAFAGMPPDGGGSLYPGKTIVSVGLDLSRPLLEPPQAWQCLDAVVLSPAAFTRLDESQIATLSAGGTVIAVRSKARPQGQWPWARVGEDWVLRFSPAGPAAMIEPAAYAPTYEWERGWPATYRRRVFLAAVLFCVLGAAVLLWRSRGAIVAYLALSGLFAAALAAWYSKQSPVLQLAAAVRVERTPFTQFDVWTWHSPVREADGSFPAAAGLAWPVFASGLQAEQTQARLECSPAGRPDRFLFHLAPGQSLAFLSRDLRPDAPAPPALTPARGPFADLATTLYSRPGDAIAGQYSAQGSIPVVVVRNASP